MRGLHYWPTEKQYYWCFLCQTVRELHSNSADLKKKKKETLRSSWPDFVGILPTYYLWLVFITETSLNLLVSIIIILIIIIIIIIMTVKQWSLIQSLHSIRSCQSMISDQNFWSLMVHKKTPKHAGFYVSRVILYLLKYLLPPSLLPPFDLL